MKKITLLALVAFTFILPSCKKENVQKGPESTQAVNNSAQEIYSKQIRIYDNSKKFYVDINVKSTTKEILDSYYNSALNLEMELIFDSPLIKNTITTRENRTVQPDENRVKQFEAELTIEFKSISKGIAKGFKLKNKNSAKTTETIRSITNSTSYILPDACSVYLVENLWTSSPFTNRNLVCSDYYYDSGFQYLQGATISPGDNNYFGGIGSYVRRCDMFCSASVYADVSIWSY